MTDHPKAKGDRTTLAVMLGLHEAGFAVSVPFGENTRYDLIIDDGTSLARVQCKTGGYGSAGFAGRHAVRTLITRTRGWSSATTSVRSITSLSIARRRPAFT
jgi:hypothetical protein